jgi:hypothetical protein
VKLNRRGSVGKEPLLDGFYILRKPVDFTLKNRQTAKYKRIRLSVKSGLIKIEDIQEEVADDEF